MIHLDTHVVVWLFAGELDRLSKAACAAIEEEPLAICPIVTLEIEYLYEIGRLERPEEDIIGRLQARIGLRYCSTPWHEVVTQAVPLSWTRDPFDRLIVAAALAEDARLLTKDVVIRQNCARAFWD